MARSEIDRAASAENTVVLSAEDNIAVLAHYFAYERAANGKAHLVYRVENEAQYTLKAGLHDLAQTCSAEVLAQQHAEHRRGYGVLLLLRADVDSRRGGRGGYQQTMILSADVHNEVDLVLFWLLNLCYLCPCQFVS